MTTKLLLNYSVQKAKDPILTSVIKQTGLEFNILYAKLDTGGGEILLSIDAPEERVDQAVHLFREKGVEVKEIKRAIQLERDQCIDCGACLSLCPSGALHLTGDKAVELNEDRCV